MIYDEIDGSVYKRNQWFVLGYISLGVAVAMAILGCVFFDIATTIVSACDSLFAAICIFYGWYQEEKERMK